MKSQPAHSQYRQHAPTKRVFERINPIVKKCIHRRRFFPERRPKHQTRHQE